MRPFPYKIIDLSHTLSPAIPTWDGSCGFEHHVHHDYDPEAVYKFKTHKINMSEGIGTHIDAPAHGVPGGISIDELPLSDLIVPCAMIDVSSASHERYSVSVNDIEAFEKEHGLIDPGSCVMVRTGWSQFWSDAEKYRNNHLFPSIAGDAADHLLKRGIAGIGIDTLSPTGRKTASPCTSSF
jgi:kynurenine formamidase